MAMTVITGIYLNYDNCLAGHKSKINIFTKYSGNPILVADEVWEGSVLCEPCVLHENGIFKMWYRGGSGEGEENQSVGYATSNDGIKWTKYASNPVLPGVVYPFVLKVASTYYLYGNQESQGASVFRWSSADGIQWIINNDGKSVLSPDAEIEWESRAITSVSVIYEAGETYPWKMLYGAGGFEYQTGYAYSTDGLNWTKYSNNPVLPVIRGTWRDGQCANPSPIIKIGSIYYTWVDGRQPGQPGPWVIGLVSSSNFISWTDYHSNPQLSPEYAWESALVAALSDPDILVVSGEAHQVYLTYNGGQNAMGLAYLDKSLNSFVSSQKHKKQRL